MPSVTSAILATVSCFLLVGGAYGQPSFSFFSYIGEDFFNDNIPIEASGLDIAPDGSHLVVVSDDGKILFLNLNNYESGHCMVDLSDDDIINDRSDFEGVAIDTGIWDPNNMHAYVVHEGSDDDEPYLFKIEYEYDNNGSCSATVVNRTSLIGAIPCLEDSNGIESLGLKTKSSNSEPAVFFVGVQDTGKIYEITSAGLSNGPDYCYDAGLGVEDVSASSYDGKYLWSFIDDEDMIAVVDPTKYCTLAIYDMTPPANEEGLVIDIENSLMYVASDGQGDAPSHVAIYNFTYPEDLGECLDAGAESCSGFTVCGGTPSPSPNPATTPASTSTPANTSFPTFFPTSYPDDDDDSSGTPATIPTTYTPTSYPNDFPTSSPTYFEINFSGYDVGDDDGYDDDFSSSSSSSSYDVDRR